MSRLASTPVGAVLSVVLLALWVPPAPAYAQSTPNILLIVTDDQRVDPVYPNLAHMTNVKTQLVDHGVTFANAFVATPLCIPSRAAILTAQYPHHNDIWRNADPYGGFETFAAHEAETLAVWLQRAGYTTALVGKYLNEYPGDPNDVETIPDGWNYWVSFLEGSYFDYALNENGVRHDYPDELPAQYSTRVLANKAVEFIQNNTGPQDPPIFLMFTPKAPHSPATPYPADEDEFLNLATYRPDNYNLDITDGPDWLTEVPALNLFTAGQLDEFRRDQMRSLLAVDTAIGSILTALGQAQRLNNTIVIFTSDNGFSWGEHKWKSKVTPYEEDIRVPLVIRYPELQGTPRVEDRIALNIDIAPTLLALAEGSFPSGYERDGENLMPVLTNEDDPPPAWRDAFTVEFLHEEHPGGSDPEELVPTYCAVRRIAPGSTLEDEIYIKLRVDDEFQEKEFYALDDDPCLFNNPPYDLPCQLTNDVDNGAYASRVMALDTLWETEFCDHEFPPDDQALTKAR